MFSWCEWPDQTQMNFKIIDTYVDKAIKKVITLRKLSIEKDWPCLICMSETSSANMKSTKLPQDTNQNNPELSKIILLHEKFLQFDWLRAVVFQLNLKYLLV